jgi:hypothetical protein
MRTSAAPDSGPIQGGDSAPAPVVDAAPAAPGDAAMGPVADGGGDAGISTHPCSGQLVCDDFEADSPGSPPQGWQIVIDPPGAGTISVDTTRATSGTKSVHVVSTSQTANNHIQILHGIQLPTDVFYGRARVWVTRAPLGPHWNLIEGWGYVPGSTTRTLQEQRMYEYGGVCSPNGGLGAAYLSSTTDACQPSDTMLPWNRWVCIEWKFDGTKNDMHLWLDSQPVDQLTAPGPTAVTGGIPTPSWPAPAFERVDLGWYNAVVGNGANMEMWIDDVAFDTTRIGC